VNSENFDNSIAVDECTVELRRCTYKNWTKDDRFLIAAGNKAGKPKHNLKIHLFDGISRQGLTSLRMCTGKMNSIDMQYCFRECVLLFANENFPVG
jgi:hypothetical protein